MQYSQETKDYFKSTEARPSIEEKVAPKFDPLIEGDDRSSMFDALLRKTGAVNPSGNLASIEEIDETKSEDFNGQAVD